MSDKFWGLDHIVHYHTGILTWGFQSFGFLGFKNLTSLLLMTLISPFISHCLFQKDLFMKVSGDSSFC
jgi:hypothetical protein